MPLIGILILILQTDILNLTGLQGWDRIIKLSWVILIISQVGIQPESR